MGTIIYAWDDSSDRLTVGWNKQAARYYVYASAAGAVPDDAGIFVQLNV